MRKARRIGAVAALVGFLVGAVVLGSAGSAGALEADLGLTPAATAVAEAAEIAVTP